MDLTTSYYNRSWVSYALLWKVWGDEVVVFNRDSGITHLISPVAVKVLKLIEAAPATGTEIVERLAKDSGVDVDDEMLQQLQGLLDNLDGLGLIRPSPQ